VARGAALRFRLMVNVVYVGGSHKHQMVKHSTKHYAGLDVSLKESSICIVDKTGRVCREAKVMNHPEDLVQARKDPACGSNASGSRLAKEAFVEAAWGIVGRKVPLLSTYALGELCRNFNNISPKCHLQDKVCLLNQPDNAMIHS